MELLPIGQFARLCRLSVKQLRHYDDLGLLTPAHVDPASGYRYYRPDQARPALTIAFLRSLDVPLPAIGEVLSGEGPAALGAVRDRMEADLARRQRALTALDRLLSGGFPEVEVEVVRELPRKVVAVRDSAGPETIGEVTSRCVARLFDLLGHGPPSGLLVGLFPLDLADEFVLGVAAEVPDGPETLPGGVFAAAVHTGPYDQINLTAHGLLTWCFEHGHTPAGHLREVYLSNPYETPPEQLQTRLMIRLEDPS